MEFKGPESARIQQLEDQMVRLLEEMEHQQARMERQQAEIADLRASRPMQRRWAIGTYRPGGASNRRALLKWGGAAAAAAAVTLVASEQSTQAAQAAGAADGDFLKIGNANLGTLQTSLAITGSSAGDPFFQVDASASTNPLATAIMGISNVANGAGVAGTSTGSTGFGVFGTSSNYIGVYGKGSQNGVYGISEGTTSGGFSGVYGQSQGSGIGVSGHSPGNIGVYGASGTNSGVVGQSSLSTDLYAGGTGRIRQNMQVSAGAPTSGSYNAGEMLRDSLGDLYICTVGGSPGTWKKVAAIPAGTPGGAIVFLPKPFRLFDTRPGVAGCPIDPGTPMIPTQITTLQVTGTPSTTDSTLVVPSGATGIVGDLLGINTASNGVSVPGNGFLTLQPHSGSATGNSYLHYYGDDVVQIYHNSFTIGLSSDGKLDVGNFGSTTNVGIDIMGYII